MNPVTQILDRLARNEPSASAELLPLVYEELRRLAAFRMSQDAPGQTLQPTALVHEAYLRLVDVPEPQSWDGRGHFFAAAAEAMRRILVENARRKMRLKRGGDLDRVPLEGLDVAATAADDQLLAVSESLDRLAALDPEAAELIKLRFFAGLPNIEAAALLNIPERTAKRRRVEALLDAAGDSEDILPGTPSSAANPRMLPPGTMLERPGMAIGRYTLLEEIGEGGCGVVYLAEQREPVRRRVALKILKPGMDTRSVVARFEAERQALALMDHPNIARVLDGGATETGRPFFVMELVRGAASRTSAINGGFPRGSGSGFSCRSATPSSTRIRRGSSIATSSLRTSW